MKKKLLIYGAGAIGRGYIPWVYPSNIYDYYYVEANPLLRGEIKKRGAFTTYKAFNGAYDVLRVEVSGCFEPGEEIGLINDVSAVITCVGPRNFPSLEDIFREINVPVICCENDINLPRDMSERTRNPNIIFAIPDVITSSTASDKLLEVDPLAIITESGTFYADQLASGLEGDCIYLHRQELEVQWAAKLYIHNTPHCIAAYLGNILGVRYLHEAMQSSEADQIVEGSMKEMESMLRRSQNIDEDFLSFYSQKELSRFRNSLLCDPISRVAREPFRKLAPNDRLIGAAQRALASGIVPHNLIIGIMAAFCFDSFEDPDMHIKYLLRSLTPEEFLRTIIRLRDTEALYALLLSSWSENLNKINKMKNEKRKIT